jgi:hypothetical protein
MPHKYNADRRHRIPRTRYKVTNWRDYEAGLRKRGSLTIWFSEEAVAAWQAAPRTTPGGQARYSDLAVETALILRTVFHQPLRQTEGLVGSLLALMGLDLPVPDHTTLSRRARTLAVAPQAASGPVHLLVDSTGVKLSGPGEWLVEKHGTQRRRAWRKLHLGVDARTGTIVASTLASKEVDDAAELGPLLDQIDEPLAAVIADGAYDQDRVYDGVAEHSAEAAVVVPPRSTAVLSASAETDSTRPPYADHCRAGSNGLAANLGLQCESWGRGNDESVQAHHRRHLALPQPTGPGGRNQDRRQHPQPHARPRTPELRPRRLRIKGPGPYPALLPPCTKASVHGYV